MTDALMPEPGDFVIDLGDEITVTITGVPDPLAFLEAHCVRVDHPTPKTQPGKAEGEGWVDGNEWIATVRQCRDAVFDSLRYGQICERAAGHDVILDRWLDDVDELRAVLAMLPSQITPPARSGETTK